MHNGAAAYTCLGIGEENEMYRRNKKIQPPF
jgi:hypothetical protein